MLATEAVVMLQACATAFSGGKKAHDQFKKFLENFSDGEDI